MSKWQDKSDFEINAAVAEKLGFEVAQFSCVNIGRQWCIKDYVGGDWVPKRIPDGVGWDLHANNIMQRKDGTLVIIDPWVC